jgi:tRNA threonylcarbamoyladenosine biosynthesis protein TsaE
VEETIAAGREFSRDARAGDVLALVGDLGAGKTQFVKGVAAGLESPAEVTSPTFTLVHEYGGGRLPLYHFDFCRLENPQAVLQLGFDDYLDGLSVIEWADRFPDLIPDHAQWISFQMKSKTARTISATRADTIRDSRIASGPHAVK